MDKTDCKTDDRLSIPSDSSVVTEGSVRTNIMLEHRPRGATSLHVVYLQTDKRLSEVKKSLEVKLKVPADSQKWFYKNMELKDTDLICDVNMQHSDYIHIKRVTSQI